MPEKRVFINKSFLENPRKFKRIPILSMREEIFQSIYKFGDATVIIHSELGRLTAQEKKEWFEREIEKKNPILMNIQRAIRNCYLSSLDE
ncbi:hypothetical protein [Cytobacillus oceanisediminis]|uniref:hypothetical protein n=1 Tax=Cytobacillus oceanisediminis TaxID=665099 RepID=UPI0037369512